MRLHAYFWHSLENMTSCIMNETIINSNNVHTYNDSDSQLQQPTTTSSTTTNLLNFVTESRATVTLEK